MIGQQFAGSIECLDAVEEILQQRRTVDIRRHRAGLAINLSQRRGAETVLAATEVDQQQRGRALVGAQLRRQRVADINHRRETGDHQRHRRGHGLLLSTIFPDRAHGHGVLADRDGQVQRRAKLHADRMHGIEQIFILLAGTGSRHPVRRQFDVGELGDARRRDVGDGFAHGETGRRRRIEDGHRRALTHRHGFAGFGLEAGRGHGDIGHRHLPGADHLLTGYEAGHRTVADGDEELLGRHRRQTQHARGGIGQRNALGIEGRLHQRLARKAALHLRRLAEQHLHGHVHRIVAELRVGHGQVTHLGRFTEHGKQRPLTLADGLEQRQAARLDGQHIAFLCLIAPNLDWCHARLQAGDGTQVQRCTQLVIVDQLRHRVRQTARADIVNRHDGVVRAHAPAGVDDFLRTPLHFRVIALHRGEIEILGAGTAGHGGCCAATQTDQQRRATEHDQQIAGLNRIFLHMIFTDIAVAAGDHDGFVVARHFSTTDAVHGHLETAEIPAQRRTAEFVVECRAAERTINHDVQRGHDAAGLAVGLFPGLLKTGDI